MRITGERAVKENKYDDEVFFNKYKEMSRSVYGLKGAGEHPVFTAYGSQDWYYDDQGNILHFPVDNYYYEGKREAAFLGEKVIKYHRTLTTYLETLLENGFSIRHVVEPPPPEDMMDLPGMRDEMRRPMMLLVCAEKRGDCLR